MSSKNRERKYIVNFIKTLQEKNFSVANKNLEKIIHEKIKNKITIVAQKPLF